MRTMLACNKVVTAHLMERCHAITDADRIAFEQKLKRHGLQVWRHYDLSAPALAALDGEPIRRGP
jgi:hypothetical protein